jgi:hypothetical protein
MDLLRRAGADSTGSASATHVGFFPAAMGPARSRIRSCLILSACKISGVNRNIGVGRLSDGLMMSGKDQLIACHSAAMVKPAPGYRLTQPDLIADPERPKKRR